ncbi:MAG: ATP synthase F1 subunit epsilon [Oscillospiraceae bacterium]|nr:ATP synthase F1 subunit epsilon [Oscillospiraceae bacterium]
MADKKLRLKVATPAGFAVDQDCDMIIMRCTDGDMGVLPGHQASSVILDHGVLRLIDDGVEYKLAVMGGVGEVERDVMTILTPSALWPHEIDAAMARSEKEDAERRLEQKLDEHEERRNKALLARALVHVEVSTHVVAQVDRDV